MAAIGELFVQISSKCNADGLNATIDKLDELAKKNENINKSFKIIGATLLGFATSGVFLIKNLTESAIQQENAERALANAMKQAGTFTEQAYKHNIAYASSLQKITIYGDETITGVQKLLSNFGVEGEMLDKLTKATLDLASAKGMDLKGAADLVSKSVGSSTNALTRYGIEVTGAVGSTQRMQTAVENITKLFGGSAQAQAQTFSGQIIILKNRMDDLKEGIGFALIPTLKYFTGYIEKIINLFEKLTPQQINLIAKFLLIGTAVSGLLGTLALLIGFLPQLAAGITLVIGAINPLTIVITLLTVAIGTFAVAWATNWGNIRERTAIVVAAITGFFRVLMDSAVALLYSLASTFATLGKILANPFKAKEHFEEWKNNVKTAVDNVVSSYTVGIEAIKQKSEELKNKKIADAQQTAKTEQNIQQKKLTAMQIADKQALIETERQRQEAELYRLSVLAEQGKQEIEFQKAQNKTKIELVTALYDSMTNAFSTMFQEFIKGTKSANAIFKSLFQNMADMFIAEVTRMIVKWLVFKALTLAFGGGFTKLLSFATGVNNFSGGLVRVGEQGPETVLLPRGSSVMTAGETNQMIRGNNQSSTIINVSVTGNTISDNIDLDNLTNTISDKILKSVKNERHI
ncbi:MAG TPA: hypothetical protein DCE80_14395 [Ignavibacteriales bacterium]|nr:hypothetical protein [Ignavibacteriales bacterium]